LITAIKIVNYVVESGGFHHGRKARKTMVETTDRNFGCINGPNGNKGKYRITALTTNREYGEIGLCRNNAIEKRRQSRCVIFQWGRLDVAVFFLIVFTAVVVFSIFAVRAIQRTLNGRFAIAYVRHG